MLPGTPALPASGSWLTFGAGSLVMTACKQSEDGRALIVRAFNPTDEVVEQGLESIFRIESAAYADMLEQPNGELPVRGRKVTLRAGPRKIVTIRLELPEDLPVESPPGIYPTAPR
jgi:alpha-mannosidase